MTKEKICMILEEFSILCIKTAYCPDLTVEEQHSIIVEAVEKIAETVILGVKRSSTVYNYN